MTTELKEEYIKFDGRNEMKFHKWAIKTKKIGVRKVGEGIDH